MFGSSSHETVIDLLADIPEYVHRLFQGLSNHGVFLHGDDWHRKVGMQVRVIGIPEDEWAPSHISFVRETYRWNLTNLGWLIVLWVAQEAGETRLTPSTWNHKQVIISISIHLGMPSI